MKKMIYVMILIFVFTTTLTSSAKADDEFNIFLMRFKSAVKSHDIQFIADHTDADCDFGWVRFKNGPKSPINEKIKYILENSKNDMLATLKKGYAEYQENGKKCYSFPKAHFYYKLKKPGGKKAKMGDYIIIFIKTNGKFKMIIFCTYSM